MGLSVILNVQIFVFIHTYNDPYTQATTHGDFMKKLHISTIREKYGCWTISVFNVLSPKSTEILCVGYQQQVAVLKSETGNYWLSSNRFVLMKQYY